MTPETPSYVSPSLAVAESPTFRFETRRFAGFGFESGGAHVFPWSGRFIFQCLARNAPQGATQRECDAFLIAKVR
jgi:hypothetical protein